MKKLFTSLFVILIILVAIILSIPYFVGIYAQSTYEKIIATANSFSNTPITITNYHRGWFNSTATLQINTQNLYRSKLIKDQVKKLNDKYVNVNIPKINYIIIQQNIKNGPVIFDNGKLKFALAIIHGSLQFKMQQGQECQFLKGLEPLFSQTSIINLNGSMSGESTIKPYNYQDNKIKFNSAGLSAQTTATADLKNITEKSVMPSISFSTLDKKVSFQIGAINSSFSKTRHLGNMWLGKANFSIKKINLQFMMKPFLSADNIQFNSQANVHDNLLDQEFTDNF